MTFCQESRVQIFYINTTCFKIHPRRTRAVPLSQPISLSGCLSHLSKPLSHSTPSALGTGRTGECAREWVIFPCANVHVLAKPSAFPVVVRPPCGSLDLPVIFFFSGPQLSLVYVSLVLVLCCSCPFPDKNPEAGLARQGLIQSC